MVVIDWKVRLRNQALYKRGSQTVGGGRGHFGRVDVL